MKIALFTVVLVFASSVPAIAQTQDMGTWYSASEASNKVTGDITIKNGRVTIDLRSYPLAAIRVLTPAELSAVFAADPNSGPVGNLYRLIIPASVRFAHHNTLCGGDDTQWMATCVKGKSLQAAFFSGTEMPKLTFEAVAGGNANLCGTYIYAR